MVAPNYAASRSELAKSIGLGWGVPRDLSQARAWMQKVAAGGSTKAKDWLIAHPA
jgi:TPR repeat protein